MKNKNIDEIMQTYAGYVCDDQKHDLKKFREAPSIPQKRQFFKTNFSKAISFACVAILIFGFALIPFLIDNENPATKEQIPAKISLSQVSMSVLADFDTNNDTSTKDPTSSPGFDSPLGSDIKTATTLGSCLDSDRFTKDIIIPNLFCEKITVLTLSAQNKEIGIFGELRPINIYVNQINVYYTLNDYEITELSYYKSFASDAAWQNLNIHYQIEKSGNEYVYRLYFSSNDIDCYMDVFSDHEMEINDVVVKIFDNQN